MTRNTGWLLVVAIVVAIGGVLLLNLDLGHKPHSSATEQAREAPKTVDALQPVDRHAGSFREYRVSNDDAIVREAEGLEIDAIYFPAVAMEGMVMPAGDDVVHLEADVRATAGNRNGFALGQFIPYMNIEYEIMPVAGGETLSGRLTPMVARDGLHYGATIVLPGPGTYRLIYRVQPPSSGGLGRHDDPVTGVAPWWKPFEVSWDWNYQRAK